MIPVHSEQQPNEMDPETNAREKAKIAKKIAIEGDKDMASNAAIWAGHGTPLPLTPGDVETMAARKGGFDSSLIPGG